MHPKRLHSFLSFIPSFFFVVCAILKCGQRHPTMYCKKVACVRKPCCFYSSSKQFPITIKDWSFSTKLKNCGLFWFLFVFELMSSTIKILMYTWFHLLYMISYQWCTISTFEKWIETHILSFTSQWDGLTNRFGSIVIFEFPKQNGFNKIKY